MLEDKRYREISGVLLFLAGIIVLFSLATFSQNDYRSVVFNRPVENIIGPVGALIAHLFRSAFGIASYIFILMFFLAGWAEFRKGELSEITDRLFTLFFLTVSIAAFLATAITDIHQNSGGFIGYYIFQFLKSVTGVVGSYLIIVVMNLAGLILLGAVSLTALFEKRGRVAVLKTGVKKIFCLFAAKSEVTAGTPLNNIGEDVKKNVKVPWITK